MSIKKILKPLTIAKKNLKYLGLDTNLTEDSFLRRYNIFSG